MGLVKDEQWFKAAIVCDSVLGYIVNVTGGVNSDDVRLFSDDSNSAAITAYLNRQDVRLAYGVGVVDRSRCCSDPRRYQCSAEALVYGVQSNGIRALHLLGAHH